MKRILSVVISAATIALVGCGPSKEPSNASEAEPATPETASEPFALETADQNQRAAYALGANIGSFLDQQLASYGELGIELDTELMLRALRDAVEKESALSEEEINTVLAELQTRFREASTKRREQLAAENLIAGRAYLEDNAQREGVIVTDSGLQYEVLVEGDGPRPTREDSVRVHYHGRLIDGTVFDSSIERDQPATFPVTGVIRGWVEGLQLMKVGSKYRFYIPAELAYGPRVSGKIQGNSALVFDVELLGIEN